jgi:hypothetical protein
MILTCHKVKDEIRRLSQRYADRMEEHSNILTKKLMRNVKTLCRLKRRLSLVLDWCDFIGHMPIGIYFSTFYNT